MEAFAVKLFAAIGIIALAVLLFSAYGHYILDGWNRHGKQGKRVLLIFSIGMTLYAGAKHGGPAVMWDDYLADSGTHYSTNGVILAGVNFRWTKTRVDLPNAQPLYISKMPTNGTDWAQAATTYVGANAHDLTLADPEGYRYYVWHEWEPPEPVHTNVVWLGQFIEKANGSTGTDKIIVIKGQIIEHGKVLAP